MPQTKRTVKGVLSGLLGLVGLSAVAGVLATAAVTPAIAVAGVSGSQALTIFDNLPNSLTPGAPMEPTTFYGTGTDGKPFELAKFYDQNRVPVTFDQVSPVLYDAILSSEDKSFYSHGGVNLGATAKAVIDNLRGTSSRGASTISQQFVKNVLIQECEWDVKPTLKNGEANPDYTDELQACWTEATQAKGAEGIERKLQEMRYAIQIEKDFSKNDILLGYLNVANFGGQTYGIEAASNYYFGTTAKNLTLGQAATLAGIVQNPNRYRIDRPGGTGTDKAGNPTNGDADGYAATKVRRNYVLDRMYENGQITEAQHKENIEAPIVPAIHPSTQGCAAAGDQAYFCQYAKSFIETDEAFGKTRAERTDLLRRGGLKVYTSLDMRVQQPGNDAMHKYAPEYVDRASAAGAVYAASGVTIEAATGRVLAIVQNTKFNETESAAPGQTGQVFAADSDHNGATGFGPGSAYKLFTLLDWLEKGHSVNENLDGRYRSNGRWKVTVCGESSTVTAKTKNFANNPGYAGTPMRFTAASLNTGFYAMAEKLDLCDISKMAERLGVHTGQMKPVTDLKDQTLFPTVLGSHNIAPIQMAGAFATVGNKGIYCQPRALDRVVGPDGEDLTLPKTTCTQVISPEVAATAAHALRGVMSATGGAANVGDGIPLIGKTGTNENFGTAMATSSTKTATFVFSGFDRNLDADWVDRDKRVKLSNLRGPSGMQLSQVRFPLSRALQGAANDAYGGGQFDAPDRNLTRQVMKELPDVVGKSVDEATRILEEAGFAVLVGAAVDSTVGAGLVAQQDPGPGRVAGGTTVTINPSTGKPPADEANEDDDGDGDNQLSGIPNVVGMKVNDAKKAINQAGYRYRDVGCRGNDRVTGQDPGPGEAPARTVVTVSCED